MLVIATWNWSAISAAVNVIAACVIATATVVYTRYTIELVKETSRLRRMQTQPFVVAYLAPRGEGRQVDVVIKNVGAGVATRIKIEWFGLDDVNPVPFDFSFICRLLSHGLATLTPSEERRFCLGGADWMVELFYREKRGLALSYCDIDSIEQPPQKYVLEPNALLLNDPETRKAFGGKNLESDLIAAVESVQNG